MKNFKKVLAFVLAFTMIMSTMSLSFAEEATAKTAGESLLNLKLINELNEEGSASLGDAIVMLSRMLNWDLESAADVELTFEDVKSYQEAAVKFAVKNYGVNGVNASQLSDKNSVKQMVGLYLKVLGKYTEYSKVAEDAMTLGLADTDLVAAFDEAATRANLFVVVKNSLSLKGKDSETTIMEELIANGKVDKAAAIAEGLYEEPVPETFEITEVTPLGLAQTAITFNKDIDKENLGKVLVNNKEAKLAISEDDDKVLIATHTAKPVENQEKAKVKISGTKDLDGNAVASYEEEIDYVDNEVPTIVNMEFIGKKHLKIVMSEAIKDLANTQSKVKNNLDIRNSNKNRQYINKASVDKTNPREVLVNLSTTLKDGDYTVKVKSAFEDFAGWNVMGEESITYTKDEEEPQIESIVEGDTTNTYVKLKFNKTLSTEPKPITKLDDRKNFRHTNSKSIAESVTISGSYVELAWDSKDALPDGDAHIIIEQDAFEDLYGVKNPYQYYTIEIEKDVEAPTFKLSQKGESKKEIVVEYNEAVDKSSALDDDNYEVTKDGEKLKINRVTKETSSEKKYYITLKDDVDGEIIVTIDNVKDKFNNAMDETEKELVVSDKTLPEMAKINSYLALDGDLIVIRVFYPETMLADGTRYAINNLDNYMFGKDATNLKTLNADDIEVNIDDNDKTAILTIPEDVAKDKYSVTLDKSSNPYTVSTCWFQVARVADSSNNTTKELANVAKQLSSQPTILVTPTAVAANKLEIEFAAPMSDVHVEDFTLKVGATGTPEAFDDKDIISSELSDDGKKFTIEFDKVNSTTHEIAPNFVKETIEVITIGSPTSVSRHNVPLKGTTAYKVKNKIAPTLTNKDDLKVSENKLVLSFDKDVKIINVDALGADLTLTRNNDKLEYGNTTKGFKFDSLATGNVVDEITILLYTENTDDKLPLEGNYEIKLKDSSFIKADETQYIEAVGLAEIDTTFDVAGAKIKDLALDAGKIKYDIEVNGFDKVEDVRVTISQEQSTTKTVTTTKLSKLADTAAATPTTDLFITGKAVKIVVEGKVNDKDVKIILEKTI